MESGTEKLDSVKARYVVVQWNLAIWDFAMWETCLYGTVFLGMLKHILLCTSPGYVGHLAMRDS